MTRYLCSIFAVHFLLLTFIIQNEVTVKKILNGMEKIFQQDNNITMLKLTFLREKHQQLSTKELDKLSSIAFYFFRSLNKFAKSKMKSMFTRDTTHCKVYVMVIEDLFNCNFT